MKYLLANVVNIITLIGCSNLSYKTDVSSQSKLVTVQTYTQAQKEFNKKNYLQSIEYFEKFIEANKHKKDKRKVFWSIDQVGRIYLRVEKSPGKAIKFFNKVLKDVKLNDADEDTIQEWISVSKEWKKLGKMPRQIKKPEELFFLGEQYYQQGMDKLQYPADDSGNADFYIAATYLVPYVFNFDDGKNIGKALFMLGNIRHKSWNDYEYWTENFYLKEVIRRFPKTKLSWKAYQVLEKGVKTGYTGSGGDSTPPSQLKMLQEMKILAKP